MPLLFANSVVPLATDLGNSVSSRNQGDSLEPVPRADIDQPHQEKLRRSELHEEIAPPLLPDRGRRGQRGKHHPPVFLCHRRYRFGERGTVGPHHGIDLIFDDELLVEGGRRLGIGSVVVDQELDLPTQDAALLVDVFLTEQVPVASRHTLRVVGPRLGHRGADPDRLLRHARPRQLESEDDRKSHERAQCSGLVHGEPPSRSGMRRWREERTARAARCVQCIYGCFLHARIERRDMNLRHLQTFVRIAEAGSIARAGARLNVSQPAASRQILALEAELGVRLFDRIGRRLRLTSEGEDLLRQSRRLLMEADSLDARARALKGGHTGILRVGRDPDGDREHALGVSEPVPAPSSRCRGAFRGGWGIAPA